LQIFEKISERQISEDELRFSFHEYTKNIWELAIGEQDFSKNSVFVNTFWNRIFWLRKNYTKNDLSIKVFF